MRESDNDYSPFFMWLALGLFFAFAAVPSLFVFWPWVGPGAMFLCFVVAACCIFRGIFIGDAILNGSYHAGEP